ncbi:hypothetical protein PQQ86_20275 [Paraburkholderia sediminicola]|uniref:hypothetical protein n=1 Tax=Paraburkholderia sediminicola TaxID=458836 RepID=UPI0038BD7E7B
MRTDPRLASAVFVALATFALSGCGADDSGSASTSSSSTTENNAVAQSATTAPAAAMLNASVPLAAGPAAASDPITQNMQASLAADSQQVTPVMHYAPGDNANSN